MLKQTSSCALMMALGMALVVAAGEPAKKEPAKKLLTVGSPAPAMMPGQWLKGEPVKAFEKGTIYVVDFWATWCAPCISSTPHLSELQAKYKDQGVVIIGQSCLERKTPSQVADLVEKMGDKMNYRVALDDVSENEKGAMYTSWMAAAGKQGLPTAFVVGRDGKIAGIAHPMALDGVLAAMVAGTSTPD